MVTTASLPAALPNSASWAVMVRSWKYPTRLGRGLRSGSNRCAPAEVTFVPATMMLCTEYSTGRLDSVPSRYTGIWHSSQVTPRRAERLLLAGAGPEGDRRDPCGIERPAPLVTEAGRHRAVHGERRGDGVAGTHGQAPHRRHECLVGVPLAGPAHEAVPPSPPADTGMDQPERVMAEVMPFGDRCLATHPRGHHGTVEGEPDAGQRRDACGS